MSAAGGIESVPGRGRDVHHGKRTDRKVELEVLVVVVAESADTLAALDAERYQHVRETAHTLLELCGTMDVSKRVCLCDPAWTYRGRCTHALSRPPCRR